MSGFIGSQPLQFCHVDWHRTPSFLPSLSFESFMLHSPSGSSFHNCSSIYLLNIFSLGGQNWQNLSSVQLCLSSEWICISIFFRNSLDFFPIFSCHWGAQPPDVCEMNWWSILGHVVCDASDKILMYKHMEPYTLIRILTFITAFIFNNHLATLSSQLHLLLLYIYQNQNPYSDI